MLPPTGFGPLPDSDIFNGGSQSFIYTVSDQNGNPITGNSTVTVTATAGLISGNTSVTIPDTQRGSTVFGVTWQNNSVTAGNTGATLTVSVNSAPNGSVTASVSRLFIGPLTITPTSANLTSSCRRAATRPRRRLGSFYCERRVRDPAVPRWGV